MKATQASVTNERGWLPAPAEGLAAWEDVR